MKRKINDAVHDDNDDDDDDDDNNDEHSLVNVEFDFHDPKPIDFHGLKSLLRQTFWSDSDALDLSDLADLVISQPHIGSVVKVDGSSDPYAVMTVLSFREHKDKASVSALANYLIEKSKAAERRVRELMDKHHIGILISERLVNMPSEIVAPLLRMLDEELTWAAEEGKLPQIDYFIYISKSFTEAPEEDREETSHAKKKKKKKAEPVSFNFHPEDEIFQNVCVNLLRKC